MEGAGFAEKVRKSFEQREFKVDTDAVTVTISIGVAVWPVQR
jgi:PleD family two-component response regulator